MARIPKNFMREHLLDVTEASLKRWEGKKRLTNKEVKRTPTFTARFDIDGHQISDREVTHIKAGHPNNIPPHAHARANETIIIRKGSGTLDRDGILTEFKPGDRLPIVKGTWHGFNFKPGEKAEFISVSSPRIKDHITGKFDLIDTKNAPSLMRSRK